MLFYQCHFTEMSDWNPRKTVGWIPERGAKQGAVVELPEFGAFFRVTRVNRPGLDEQALRAKQNRDRGFGASIR